MVQRRENTHSQQTRGTRTCELRLTIMSTLRSPDVNNPNKLRLIKLSTDKYGKRIVFLNSTRTGKGKKPASLRLIYGMRGRTAQLLKQTGHNSGVQDRSSRAGCPLFGEIRVDVRCVSVAERISLMATNTVAVLAANTYGKSRVRVLHLKRGSQHIPHDFTVQVLLEVSARFFFAQAPSTRARTGIFLQFSLPFVLVELTR